MAVLGTTALFRSVLFHLVSCVGVAARGYRLSELGFHLVFVYFAVTVAVAAAAVAAATNADLQRTRNAQYTPYDDVDVVLLRKL